MGDVLPNVPAHINHITQTKNLCFIGSPENFVIVPAGAGQTGFLSVSEYRSDRHYHSPPVDCETRQIPQGGSLRPSPHLDKLKKSGGSPDPPGA